MPTVDFLFRVHGDCVRAGYGYQLYGAVKAINATLAGQHDVFFGPLEGVRHFGRGYLGINHQTRWRVRAPRYLSALLLDLCGKPLRVGAHVIQLGEVMVQQLRFSHEIYAEMVAVKSLNNLHGREHPTHREFTGHVVDRLRRNYGIRTGYIAIGRRRVLHMGEHPAHTGYALGVYGLDNSTSLAIQKGGLGGRRHMGAGLSLPGQLPPWVHGGDPQLFSINKSGGSHGTASHDLPSNRSHLHQASKTIH